MDIHVDIHVRRCFRGNGMTLTDMDVDMDVRRTGPHKIQPTGRLLEHVRRTRKSGRDKAQSHAAVGERIGSRTELPWPVWSNLGILLLGMRI